MAGDINEAKLKDLISFGMAMTECACPVCMDRIVTTISEQFPEFKDARIVHIQMDAQEEGGTIH